MNINVINQFAPIFDNDSEYLIINGGMKSGKFYAACQKAVVVCLSRHAKIAVFCPYKKYAFKIFREILGDENMGMYNLHRKSFIFDNGSEIQLLRYDDLPYIPIYDYAVVKEADFVSKETFENIDRRTKKQIVFTCNLPSRDHWIRKLYEKESCDKIDVENNGSIFNGVFENE